MTGTGDMIQYVFDICYSPAILKWKPPAAALESPEGEEGYKPRCAVSHLQAMFARLKMSKQRYASPIQLEN
jgi:hypothetical protein